MSPARQPSIHIDVETRFLDAYSDPSRQRFVFAYTITIHNDGPSAARLLSRNWVITDGDGKVRIVRGDGVIGEQPRLESGHSFTYASGAVLNTPVATMQGSYRMVSDAGHTFFTPVPPFRLATPTVVN